MIVAPYNLHGIDSQINLIQRYLDEKLSEVWLGTLKVYGRAIVTEKDGTKRLEFWEKNNDYKEQLVTDKSDAIIGFKVNDRSIVDHRLMAEIDIIFTVNVKAICAKSDYVDEKALMQAHSAVRNCGYIAELKGMKIGIDNVFAGFETDNIKHRDMSPFHIFSFTVDVEYFSNICE